MNSFKALALLLTFSSPALAEPTWDTTDTVLASLTGAAGSVGGGLVGGFLGVLGGCDSEFCFFDILYGAAIGSTVGAASGVAIYGRSQGFEGSLWATFLGSVGGTLAGGLVGTIFDNPMGSLIIGQTLGATMGYAWTAKSTANPVISHGGLIDFDDQHGLRLAMPAGGVQIQRDGSLGYNLTLAAGTW